MRSPPARCARFRATGFELAPATGYFWLFRFLEAGSMDYFDCGSCASSHSPSASLMRSRFCSARYAPSAEPALPSWCPLATPRPCSSISTKSQRKSPPAHTPFSFSIKLDGTAPKTSRLPKASRSCRCRRVRRSCIKQRSLRSVGHGGAGSTGGIAQRLDHIGSFSAVWRP